MPGKRSRQGYRTLPQQDEQASGDQVSRCPRIAAMAISSQPGIKLGERGPALFANGPTRIEHIACMQAHLGRFGLACLASNQRVRVCRKESQLALNNRLLKT